MASLSLAEKELEELERDIKRLQSQGEGTRRLALSFPSDAH